MRKIIGLTGSIATGKSTVAKLFIEAGIYVIDSDMLAKEVSKEPEVLQEVHKTFGPQGLDEKGQMNREFVASVVFCDREKRMQLNDIVHPRVKAHIKEIVEKRKNELVIVDVPLMYETDFHEMMDDIIVVYCTEEQQIDRLMHRNHLEYDEALLRVRSQMSIEEKVALADYVLDNSGTKMDLYKNFRELLKKIKG